MRYLLMIFMLLTQITANAANSTDEIGKVILNEGRILFRMEKASWYATDYFLANFKSKSDSIGGYLSYIAKDNKVVSILYSRYDSTQLLVRFRFDSIPQKSPLSIDVENNKATAEEIELIILRQDVLKIIASDTEKFFKHYENTSYHIIPIINDTSKRVFILTDPQKSGEVLLGNDYLLKYNSNNILEKKEKLHTELITLPYKNKGSKPEPSMHPHTLNDYITSTDICTLLLYRDFVDWKNHIVIGKKYVTIFWMNKEELTFFSKELFEKMMKK